MLATAKNDSVSIIAQQHELQALCDALAVLVGRQDITHVAFRTETCDVSIEKVTPK